MFTDCSIKTQQDRCSFQVFTEQVLRQNIRTCDPRVLYSIKSSFKTQGVNLPGKQNLKEFTNWTLPAQEEFTTNRTQHVKGNPSAKKGN